MLYTLRFFSSKCSLFHNANLFGSCIIHILYTVCAKIKKKNSGAKGLSLNLISTQTMVTTGNLSLQGYILMVEPEIEPGTSLLVDRDPDH